MAQKNNIFSSRSLREYFLKVSSFFLASRSRVWIRNVVVVIYLLVFVWLVYSRVYSTLGEEVPLPVNLDRDNPNLDIKTLQAINAQRADRLTREKPDFFIFSRVFVLPNKNE